MKADGLNIICDDGKYEELIQLYNDWVNEVRFSSIISMEEKSWKVLENYCLANKEETFKFFLDGCDNNIEFGHFVHIFHIMFPNAIRVISGYIPIDQLVKLWRETLKKL